MLRNATALTGYSLCATDGDIGRVSDFYFDDEKWTIRYLVVNTGTYLPGRRVLISPMAIVRVDWFGGTVHLAISRRDVETSPDPSTDRPVSRQYERRYLRHFGWPYYWGSVNLWGTSRLPRQLATEAPAEQHGQEDAGRDNPHLRSIHEVTGYQVRGTNGRIGHVEDFLVADDSWAIRYLVVDTRRLWPGKTVLLAPRWAERISWPERTVYLGLLREIVRSSPECPAGTPVTRDLEARLLRYYRNATRSTSVLVSAEDAEPPAL
jgi:hypothetical protein